MARAFSDRQLDGALSLKPSLEDYLPAQGYDPAAMMAIVWVLEKEGHGGKHVPPSYCDTVRKYWRQEETLQSKHRWT